GESNGPQGKPFSGALLGQLLANQGLGILWSLVRVWCEELKVKQNWDMKDSVNWADDPSVRATFVNAKLLPQPVDRNNRRRDDILDDAWRQFRDKWRALLRHEPLISWLMSFQSQMSATIAL